jgi:hypothetical protein
MDDLDRIMCRNIDPQFATVLFNGEIKIEAHRTEWPRLKRIIEFLGEGNFNALLPRDDSRMLSVDTFMHHLVHETDFLVEHTREWWDMEDGEERQRMEAHNLDVAKQSHPELWGE